MQGTKTVLPTSSIAFCLSGIVVTSDRVPLPKTLHDAFGKIISDVVYAYISNKLLQSLSFF